MKTIKSNELVTVSGGASKTDPVLQSVQQLQSSLKDVASAKNNQTDPTMFMMMGLMMSQRSSGPTVVAAPAAAAGPVVNISTRVRRW